MTTQNDNSNFSNKLSRLEEIYNNIKTMEINDIEKLIELYQEGVALSQLLNKELNAFEQKIIEIKENNIATDNLVEKEQEIEDDLINEDMMDFSDIDERNENVHASTLKDKQNDIGSETLETQNPQKIMSHQTGSKKEVSQKYIIDLFSEE